MGATVVLALLLAVSAGALFRPHLGLIGYFGWAVLKPEYLWHWALPQDAGMQKYIALATFVGIAVQRFRGNPIRGPVLYACAGLAFYLLLSMISSFQSHDPVLTDLYVDVMWKIVLMTILAVRLLDTPDKIIAMMWVAVLAQGFNAYEINMQYFRDGFVGAYFYGWGFLDSNTYSIATVPIMAFSAALALHSKRPSAQLLAGTIFLLQLHQIFLLQSRGCMLGVILLAALVWWYSPKTAKTNMVVLAGLAVAAVLAGPPVVDEFSSIFASDEERDGSADSRFGLWTAGWNITMDYPLLGVGPWGAETTVPEYYPGGLDVERKALHNLLFEASAGSGIPATIGYLAFFYLAWRLVRRRWRQRNELPDTHKAIYLSALVGIPAYWLSNMFSSGLLIESGYLCVAVALALLAIERSEIADATGASRASPNRGSPEEANLGARHVRTDTASEILAIRD